MFIGWLHSFICLFPCRFILLFFTTSLTLTLPLTALSPDRAITQYKVRSWNMESGLPGNSVLAIQQTRDGYLWVGGQGGLVRFDGRTFQAVTPADTPLENNTVRALYESSSGDLWIGCATGGLTRFSKGRFTVFPSQKHPSLLKINTINEDGEGNLWIGSLSGGLTCFSEGRFTPYTAKDGLPGNAVRRIHKDDAGDLWAVTGTGIVKIVKPGVFRIVVSPEHLPNFKTACLYKPKTQELWIGTGDSGLFSLKDGTIAPYKPTYETSSDKKDAPLHPTINCLLEDKQGNFWLGTDGGGLARMTNGVISTFEGNDPLARQAVYSIYEDREGSLWVGTLDNGLFQLSDSKFVTYTRREGLRHDFIQRIHEGPSGDLLIGTKNGVNRFSLKGWRLEPLLNGNAKLLNNSVVSLWQEPGGTIWLGTWGGLHRYNPPELVSFTTKDGLSDNRISCMLGDREGNLWVGTEKGLNRRDKSSGLFTAYTRQKGLPGDAVQFLFQDKGGRLWIGTDGGLCTLKDNALTAYNPGPTHKKRIFYCAHEDKDGTLWFGSDNGLIRFPEKQPDPSTFAFTIQEGLIENDVYSILEDETGYLWLAGPKGVSRLQKKQLEQRAQGSRSPLTPFWYNEKDGMKSRWCTGAACKTRDGRLWFGTSVGMAMIEPRQIKSNTTPPTLIFQKIIADGEGIYINRPHRGDGNILQLKPGKKRIEFHFTAPSFINPDKIRFKIKLEGYDGDWLDNGSNRTTAYTGLPPGHYTFKVKTMNADGVWNEETASFPFYLRYFFYQTTWFYVFLGLALIMAVLLLHWFRVRQLKRRKKELSREVDLRTRELKERNRDLENARQKVLRSKELIQDQNRQLYEQSQKLAELDKTKSRFFANISHEFRTPLTLIKGPLEQILEQKPGEELKSQANMMLRNSNRLLNMVEQLLELAKFDSGNMKLQVAEQPITDFLKGIVMCFQSLAQQKEVQLDFQGEAGELLLYFDPEKIERIIFNLLSNAFNYTPSGGKVQVVIRKVTGTAYPSGCVEIVVRDTGAGIPEDQLPHIFDRFYQGEGGHQYQRKGAGIGLALTRELVELHHGQIEVHSSCRPDGTSGTQFTIRLPMGNAHFPAEMIFDSADYVPGDLVSADMHVAGDDRFDRFDRDGDIDDTDRQRESDRPETGQGQSVKRDKPLILVVDDNADVRVYIRSALESQFTITEAVDGRDGLDRAVEVMPDLVISDVMMPEMDGYELCSRLKKDLNTSHIPVILLTARASETSIVQGLESWADDYVTKPFNAKILVSRVKNLIRQRRRLQEKLQADTLAMPGEISVSSVDRNFLEELQAIIEKNLSEPDFSVEELANKLYMSNSSLYRKIEALTGQSTQKYIRSYRLNRGAQLLKANFGNVTEVAFAVGFNSAPYFTKCFKEKFNKRPSDFQASDLEKNDFE